MKLLRLMWDLESGLDGGDPKDDWDVPPFSLR